MDSLIYAKYMMALFNNTVSDETRLNFLNTVKSNKKDGMFSLSYILVVYAKMLHGKNIDLAQALKSISNEYLSLGLNNTIGDYSKLENCISAILGEVGSGRSTIERCHKIIDAAAKLDDSAFKTSIYVAALNKIVLSGNTLEDTELTTNILNYIDSVDTSATYVSDFRRFTEIGFS